MTERTDTTPAPSDATRTAARWATACAALAVSAVLLSPEPVRAKASASPAVAAAKWAGQPATLSVSATNCFAADVSVPVQLGGFVATSRFVTARPVAAIRLAARTRQGGRYGP